MTYTPPPVCIYEVVKEWSTSATLCSAHVDARRAQGWTVRGMRLPPPRRMEIVDPGASGEVGASCPAAWDDRETLRCQDCHLAALPACPTCGGPAVYPGSVGLGECHDPAHDEFTNSPTQARATAGVILGTKKSGRKKFTKPGGSP